MKKIILLLVVLFTMVVFIGCEDDPGTPDEFEIPYIVQNEKAFVFSAPDTVNIMKDLSVLTQCEYWGEDWTQESDELYTDGIKGDCAAVQLMFTAKQDIEYFKVTAQDLETEDGDVIEKDCIEVLAERYIEVKSSSSTSKKASCFTGWYADALVPMANYILRKDNKITANENQGVWLNVLIPSNAVAGIYYTELKVKLDDVEFYVPLTVKVYDSVMPEEAHRKTALDIWENEIGDGETLFDDDGNLIDWNTSYYNFLLSKRVSAQHIPNQVFGQNYANDIVQYARNPQVSSYRLPYGTESHDFGGQYGSQSVVSYDSLVEQLTLMANKNIALRQEGDSTTDLFKKAFYYFGSIIDEPGNTKYAAVRYCDLAVTNAKKEVATLLEDYPDLQASLLAIPHVVTTTYNTVLKGDEVNGGVQTWCTEVQRGSSEFFTGVRERAASTEYYSIGEGAWTYMTCTSNNPYPSFQLDDNLSGVRILNWITYDYGIQCILFWNVCYYHKHVNSSSVRRDVWNDPKSWDTANGDGYLLYPGSRYGLSTPISTLRLESFRQGIEEYEYLWMINDYIEKYNLEYSANINALEVINKLVQPVYAKGTSIPITDVQKFKQTRVNLLEVLEEMSKNPSDIANIVNNLYN